MPLKRPSRTIWKRGFQRRNQQSEAARAARWGERLARDAGVPAPAPRAPYPPPSAASHPHPGALETGHCSCPRCSGGCSPNRATNRAERILVSRRRSQASCPMRRALASTALGPPAAAAATPTSASAAEPVWPKTFWIHAVRFGFKTYARCTLWLQNVRFGSNSGCHSGSGAHRRPGHARNPSGQVWTRRAGARSKYKWAGLDTEGQSPEHDEEGCTPLRRAPDCGAASLGDCPCPAGPPAGNRGTPPKHTPPQRAHGRSQNI